MTHVDDSSLTLRKQNIARHFARARDYEEHATIQRETCQLLLQSIHSPKQERVLEVGAGTGQMTRLLTANIASEYWVINELAEQQATTLKTIIPNAEIVIGDAENIDLGKDFSLIISANAVQWFDKPLKFIDQSYERLKPSGQLVFNTFTANNFLQIKQLTGQGLVYPPEDRWQQKLKQIGFKQLELSVHRYDKLFRSPYAVLKHMKKTGVSTSQTQLKSDSGFSPTFSQSSYLQNTFLNCSDSTPMVNNEPFKWTKAGLKQFEKEYWQHFATKNDQGEDCVSLTYEVLIISAIKPPTK